MSRIHPGWWSAVAVLSLSAGEAATEQAAAQEVPLVRIEDLHPHEIRAAGFELREAQAVKVRASGTDERHRRGRWTGWFDDGDRAWEGNAWILDADTRQVVWDLSREARRADRDGLYRWEGAVDLPAGRYVAHHASYTGDYRDGWSWSGGRRGRRVLEYWDDGISEDFELIIEGRGAPLASEALERIAQEISTGALLSFVKMDFDRSYRQAFTVERPTEVEIYAIGEARDEEAFDYAWLIDVATGKPVWKLEYWASDHAGGAEKNRMVRARRRLDPGTYLLAGVTDDSHDYGDWNAPPPYDPEFWGVTISAVDPSQRNRVQLVEESNTTPAAVVVDLTRARDGEVLSRGFTLSARDRLRVRALGEGRDGRMYDYGWIVRVDSRRRVWEMDYYDTEHAGGSAKNRVADEVVELDPGDYMVYYVTDGSHSYRDWNAAPPLMEESWGILVTGADQSFDPRRVEAYDSRTDPSVLAQLVQMGDHEHESVRFTLDAETAVRIYAQGEGTQGRMYDYAWLEDDTGRVVWEMTYRRTRGAGGARKNRVFDDVIRLPAGRYTLFYESDGSHSFGRWNADPPDDPVHWGVTAYRAP